MPSAPLKYIVFLALLAACGHYPELDDVASDAARNAPYPDLVPAETLRAQVAAPRITDESTDALINRGKNLKSKGNSKPPSVDASLKSRADALRARAEKLKQQ